MPTSINFDKKLGFINGTSIVLPSGPAADFSTKSLSFDGVDDYVIGDFSSGIIEGNKTVSFWVKFGDYTRNQMVLAIKGSAAGDYFSVRKYTSGSLGFGANAASQYGLAANTTLYDPTTLENWTHVLVTKRSQYIEKIFINGVDVTGGNTTVNGGANSQIKIGQIGNIGYYGGLFQGEIDELAVFDGKLDSPAQVASIYNNGKPADLTSLNPLAWYRAGENSTFAYPQILMPENTNKDKVSKYSLAFDGLSYVDCGDPDEFSFGNGSVDSRFSLSAWIYMNDATDFAIMSKYDINVEYQFFVTSADRILFRLFSGGSTLNRIGRQTDPITSFENQWIHVAATYDGSSTLAGIKIYLNGNRVDVVDSSLNTYVAMSNTNASFEIGRISAVYANGKIDEAAVFPIELGLSDVQAIYNSGIPTDISSYSPVGYWKLGEEAKFTDNWLVPNSALSNFSKYSFNFDGLDDYVNCGNGASLQFSNTLSVSCWVKTSTSSKGILAIRVGSTPTQEAFSLTSSGEVRMNNGTRLTANTSILDNNYHHIVVTYDTSLATNNLKIYIDGILDNSVDRTVVIQGSGTNYLIIGEYRASNFFNGNIDEVAVWDSELSAGAVTAIYNGGKPKDLSGFSPISWWRMGEEATYDASTSQFTIPDQGSGGNNGTSSNTMLLETLVGDAPQYYGGGISDSMDILDRVGDAPVFTNNFSLNFDGIDDSFSFSQISKSGVFSLSYWFKFTGTFNLNANCFVWGINNSNSSFIKLQTSTQVILKLDGTTYTINESGGNNIPQNTWANFTLVRNASNSVQLYLNGNVFGSSITSSNTFTINSFGRIINSSFGFLGYIDEVAYFESELSTSDVTSIYNSGIPNDISSISGLVSWWRFEEGSGTIAKDSGSGGNDGTLTNGPLYDTDRILATKANNTVSFNMEEADIVEDTP